MKKFSKPITVLILLAILGTNAPHLGAEEHYVDAGGQAYESAYEASRIAPAIALALVAIAGAIAIGVQNRGHNHHDHSHSHSD